MSEIRLASEQRDSGLREQFIAVLGHDLRNPLASVAAGVNLLKRAALAERELNIIDLMQSSVRRMAGLIDDVMDFARGRLGSGLTVSKTFTAMAPLLQQVVSEIKSLEPDAKIELNMSIAFPVNCDCNRIQQLVSNLVGNAVAYGDLSKPILISARTESQFFEISVTNAGEMIPAASLPQLFAPFKQGGKNGGSGLGLGLYVASEIARAHGGRLIASSTQTETRFAFYMPLL